LARLRAVGDATVADRLSFLREHRSGLDERIRLLQQNADALDKTNAAFSLSAEPRRAGRRSALQRSIPFRITSSSTTEAVG
jgi:hypothetical protein